MQRNKISIIQTYQNTVLINYYSRQETCFIIMSIQKSLLIGNQTSLPTHVLFMGALILKHQYEMYVTFAFMPLHTIV